MITLAGNTLDTNILNGLSEWIKTNPKLTYGQLTKQFEEEFAKYVGAEYAVFVNSGSSANLIAVYCAKLMGYKHIIIPRLCWATDYAPPKQFDMEISFCDCNLDNLSVDTEQLEDLLKSNKDKKTCILLVDVLGLQPDFVQILRLSEKYNALLIEDACESLGSTFLGKSLGTFGDIGTYSFYFSHHISTIEGGMVVTDDKKIYNMLLSLRSHGWTREWSKSDRGLKKVIFNVDDFQQDFTFYYPGFNVRSTEISAFIGLRQLPKMPRITEIRQENYNTYISQLEQKTWTPKNRSGDDNVISSFAMPIILDSNEHRTEVANFLLDNNVECRPLIAGDICKHPVYGDLNDGSNANKIHSCGMYIPNNERITVEDVYKICDLLGAKL